MQHALSFLPTLLAIESCSITIDQKKGAISWNPLGLAPTVLYTKDSKSTLLQLKTQEL